MEVQYQYFTYFYKLTFNDWFNNLLHERSKFKQMVSLMIYANYEGIAIIA